MKISLLNTKIPNLILSTKKPVIQKYPIPNDIFVSSIVSFSGEQPPQKSFQDQLYEFLVLVSDSPERFIQKRSIYERTTIQDFCSHFAKIFPKHNEIADLLNQNGLTKATQLYSLGSVYKHKSVQNAFAFQEENFLEIFSLLKNKGYLASYPLLLAHLYNEESAKDNPDFSKLEKYPAFLSDISIKNDEQIPKCFTVLRSGFNDLKTVSDIVDLIDYLLETHPKKMQLLDEILKSKPETAKFSSSYVYSMLSDAVDMHFLMNKGESLEPMQDYISSAVQMPALKAKNVEIISESFNQFDAITDVVDFFKFLAISEISVKEFNSINSKSPIEGFDLVTCVENLKILTPVVANILGSNPIEARVFYLKNSDLINSVYDDKEQDTKSLELLLGVMKAYDIKDSSSFLSLYNRIFVTKHKQLSSSQIVELAELLSYSTKDELKSSRKLNISELQLLTKNKEAFLQIENDIRQFILDDESNFFAGMSPLEVFHQYKSSFIDSSENIHNILANIVDLNISSSKDYNEKITQIRKFEPFFEDRNSLFSFMSDNQIDFSNTKESIEYKNSCLKILSSLYDEDDIEHSLKLIQKLSKSKFLKKSGSSLPEFISMFKDQTSLKSAITVLIRKKVPSVNSLDNFYKKFKTKDSTLVDMINHLSSFPEKVTFNSYKKIINSAKDMINNLNVPVSLTLDNMFNVSPEEITSLSDKTLPRFLNKLVNSDENKSFLLSLNSSYNRDQASYTRFKIAYEIVKHLNSDDKCYENLLRKMRLDKEYLFGEQDVSDKKFIDTVAKYFPSELYDFVNSNDWCKLNCNNNFAPELSLHTKLRAIARFIIPNLDMVEEISNPEHKDTMKSLLSFVYEQTPSVIQNGNNKNTFKMIYNYQGRHLHAIFDRSGKMATIYLR